MQREALDGRGAGFVLLKKNNGRRFTLIAADQGIAKPYHG
jgi:hypothetical protein